MTAKLPQIPPPPLDARRDEADGRVDDDGGGAREGRRDDVEGRSEGYVYGGVGEGAAADDGAGGIGDGDTPPLEV